MLTDQKLRKKWFTDFRDQIFYEFYIAYLDARKGGKRSTFDEHKFEMNEMSNLQILVDSILDGTYRPARGTAHVVFNPVIREIFAAPFQDRIVHHWIYNSMYDSMDKTFIKDSYSCREGKGTLYGVKRLLHHINSVTENGKKEAMVIQLDIQGYFMSIDRKRLYYCVKKILDKQYQGNYGAKYELLKFCIQQTIFDDPCEGVRRRGWPKDWEKLPKSKSLFNQKPGVGMVIGNLTSQLFSNAYLDKLDKFVTKTLGYPHYGRYVDDFYIVVPPEQYAQAKKDVIRIENFLKGMKLTLHPKKRSYRPARYGIKFLGYVVYPGRITLGRRIKRNTRQAFREVAEGRRTLDSVPSYLGLAKHAKSRTFLKKTFDELGWEYED